MTTYSIYQVDAFTTTPFQGNPAGVVLAADGLTTGQMQQIASELNNSETAFVCRATEQQADLRLRFFTPTTEVAMCGHATIAAIFVLTMQQRLTSQTLQIQTQHALLPVTISQRADQTVITLQQGLLRLQAPLAPAVQTEILAALGIEAAQQLPNCPLAIATAGTVGKVMIAVNSQTVLAQLQPYFNRLAAISQQLGYGYYVFTMNPAKHPLIFGRMFNPAAGINEDPVTGNANGPVAAYLLQHHLINNSGQQLEFTASQGIPNGRSGEIKVCVQLAQRQPTTVAISGQAVIVFTTTLTL